MSNEVIMFGNIETKERKFHYQKNSNFILEDVDIDNILISNKISSGEKSYKYLIGCMDDDYKFYKIKPFSITLSKSNAYVKYYDRCIFD